MCEKSHWKGMSRHAAVMPMKSPSSGVWQLCVGGHITAVPHQSRPRISWWEMWIWPADRCSKGWVITLRKKDMSALKDVEGLKAIERAVVWHKYKISSITVSRREANVAEESMKKLFHDAVSRGKGQLYIKVLNINPHIFKGICCWWVQFNVNQIINCWMFVT